MLELPCNNMYSYRYMYPTMSLLLQVLILPSLTHAAHTFVCCLKVVGPTEVGTPQSESVQVPNSSRSPPTPALPAPREVPAAVSLAPFRRCAEEPLATFSSSPLPAAPTPCTAPLLPATGTRSIPLQHTSQTESNPIYLPATFVPVISACIDLCVAIVHMEITTTEAGGGHTAHMRSVRRRVEADCLDMSHGRLQEHAQDEDALQHSHPKQIFDLLAWHLSAQDERWYVKPRSTCWFEEYLFQIYTPDMFYDILRMRRATFDRLVHDLRPFIQGQSTHWRQPIGVEKKVVVTLFKLMHGVSIPLVADKVALGNSTVHDILRQVCSAISTNFRHLIAWPHGRRLARVTADFQAKQWMPNCIGAIDGSHVYISAPPPPILSWPPTTATGTKPSLYCCKQLLTRSVTSHL